MDIFVYLYLYFILCEFFLKVFVESRFEKFGCLLRWYDEIYIGLDFIF